MTNLREKANRRPSFLLWEQRLTVMTHFYHFCSLPQMWLHLISPRSSSLCARPQCTLSDHSQPFRINLGIVVILYDPFCPPHQPHPTLDTHTRRHKHWRLLLLLAIGHQSSQHRLLSLTGQLTTLRVKALINPWPSPSHTYRNTHTHALRPCLKFIGVNVSVIYTSMKQSKQHL